MFIDSINVFDCRLFSVILVWKNLFLIVEIKPNYFLFYFQVSEILLMFSTSLNKEIMTIYGVSLRQGMFVMWPNREKTSY